MRKGERIVAGRRGAQKKETRRQRRGPVGQGTTTANILQKGTIKATG